MKVEQIIPELIVDNINNMVNFFSNKFDFKIEAKDPEEGHYTWVQIVNGDNRIMMQETEVTKLEIPELKARITGTDLLMLKLENADAVRSVYERFSFEPESVYMKIRVTEYGSCEFGVKDPEGRYIIVSGD